MKYITKTSVIISIAVLAFVVGSAALAGSLVDLGLVVFPPGLSNAQPFRIELDPVADTVTATPQFFGDPETFSYDQNGKGFSLIQATLFELEVDEATSSAEFIQYIHTGEIYPQQGIGPSGGEGSGLIEGDVLIDGILFHVVINQNVTPWIATVTVGGAPFGTQPVYPESNYAPFVFGPFLYAIEPDAPSPGMFQVHKWMRYSDPTISGVYTLPLVPSNVGHVVISEVQITGGVGATSNDFIELYNPTDTPFNLNGHRLVKRTASSSVDTLIKSWTENFFVPARGFALWANSNYTNIAVQPDATTTQTLAENNGVALRFGPNNTGTIVDSVAWGVVANGLGEGLSLPAGLSANQSYERKMWQDIACFTALGPGEPMGNGCDQDDNSSDFELRATSSPQNTLSMPEPL